jgi:hypothetical protein
MLLRHGDQMGNNIAEHHHPGAVYYHGFSMRSIMGFSHGCRISTSNAMASKYHGKNSWCFMVPKFFIASMHEKSIGST